MDRVIFYVDGFNFYFGLTSAGCKKWIDLEELAKKLLKPSQKLVEVNYFTTLITSDVDKRLRQKKYISALETKSNIIKVYFGKFKKEPVKCLSCGGITYEILEKGTDVALSMNIIKDLFEDRFDTAVLISGDTDYLPTIKYIYENHPKKRIIIAFPPNRKNDEMSKFSNGSMVIGKSNINQSQFPNTLKDKYGADIIKPNEWA
ncbi:MAG: NYN domain-containing protein [Chitinophagaceae bacterium]|nr:NYN domain-containing protein [Chitinophagaceae bacterium]